MSLKKIKTILTIILVILIITLIIFVVTRNKYEPSNYIIITNDTELLNNSNNSIGKLYKDAIIKVDIENSNKKLIKVKDNDYYIKTKNTKKYEYKESKKEDKINKDYILPLDYETSINKINLYKDNNKTLYLEKENKINIKRCDEKYYYFDLFNEEYSVLKKELRIKIDKKEKVYSISIPSPKNSCNENDCINKKYLDKILEYINTNYYTITKEEYNLYNKGYYKLKKGAILIDKKENSTNTSKYKNLSEIGSYDNNFKYDYNINEFTTLHDIENLLKGKEVITYTGKKAKDVAVLNYHFFYDKSKNEICNELICLEKTIFEDHLKYLKEKNYKTLTIKEFRDYMYKEINIPEKSVLITIDDGAMGTGTKNGNILIPMLEKYKLNATLFLVTGWWSKKNYQSEYLDLESHTNNMHVGNLCEKTRGAKLLCSDYKAKVNDLKASINKLESKVAFCFPFYAYDDEAIKAVKEVGFEMSFIGGYRHAKQTDNPYMIPREPIKNTDTLDRLIKILNR